MAEFDALFTLVQSIVAYGGLGVLALAVITLVVTSIPTVLIAVAFLSGRVKIKDLLAGATSVLDHLRQ